MLSFPEETDTSYMRVFPKKPLNLQAFTLCMRVATALSSSRETILFAFRTPQSDELNVWQEYEKFSLYLRSSRDAVMFTLPPLSDLYTHLCVTWESSTGSTVFWRNGNNSLRKIYKRGHRVNPDGGIVLGQDPDSYLWGFDKSQSFVGEITDVHMWDSVLTASQIKQLYEKQSNAPSGNVINWNSVHGRIYGNVGVVDV
ncbi:pentraxin fusion protein-like [Clarias gariepinus]|uniref:pentraxin fusion protein-like n=1 Tax=Clarias gariepinus TaxID=13013 RepID=UPI00234D15F6|nr:pentraxin fusion protein-like [Clarias gariepinus]